MVKFSFDVRGHVFQRGIDSIEHAYQATISTLAQQIKDAQTQASYKPYMVEDVGLPTHVMDREDYEHPEVSHAEMWAFIEENAWSSLAVAREAYLVILYHHWEKQCAEWMGAKYVEKDAFDWLRHQGAQTDESAIKRLRRIANYIKHQNPALMNDNPELIRNGNLVISSEAIVELFGLVRSSGLQTLGERSKLE